MSVSPIFKKYPKDITKKPVMDESNPLYRDVVLPCLANNREANPEAALIREFCHIPKEKISTNDFLIFNSFCKQGGFSAVADGAKFTKDLIFQSIREGNEDLFLALLETEQRSATCCLTQNDQDVLLCSATLEKGWERSMQKLIQMGANVNQKDSAGASLLDRVVSQFNKLPPNKGYSKAAILIENGALLQKESPQPNFFQQEFQDFSLPSRIVNFRFTVDFLKAMAAHHPLALRKLIEQDISLLYQSNNFGGFGVGDEETVLTFAASQFINNPNDKEMVKLFEFLLEKAEGDFEYHHLFDESGRRVLSSALEKACQMGFAELAEKIIDSNLTGYIDRCSLFQMGCQAGSISVIELFIKNNPNIIDAATIARLIDQDSFPIFGENGTGRIFLSLVASRFNRDPDDKESATLLEKLIDKLKQRKSLGANDNYDLRSLQLHTALGRAIEKGYVDLALKIIRARLFNPIALSSEWLMPACFNGCVPIIEECLRLGANPYEKDSSGRDAFDQILNGTAKSKDKLILLMLQMSCNLRIDPRLLDRLFHEDVTFSLWSKENARTFLSLVAYRFLEDPQNKDLIQLFELLIENSKRGFSLFSSRNKDLNAELITKVLEKAVSMGLESFAVKIVRANEVNNKQILHWACGAGLVVLAEECLKLGADPYESDDDGNTAFHFTMMGQSNEKERIIRLLQQYGKDVHTEGFQGYSPMTRMHFRGIDASSLLTKPEEDFLQKKLAGHVSSIADGSGFAFERGYAEIMSNEIAISLKEFFADEREEENREVRERLLGIFEQGSKITDPKVLAAQIQKGEPTLITAGWDKHAISVGFIEDPLPTKNKDEILFAVINRGNGITEKANTVQVFRANRNKVTPKLIQEIIFNKFKWTQEQGMNHFYQVLPKALSSDGTIVQDDFCRMLQTELSLPLQTVGNCSFSSLEGALRFFWTLLLLQGKTDKTQEIAAQVKRRTGRWSLSAQLGRLAKFTARFPHGPNENVPDDEAHYLKGAYAKIQKRFKKITDFSRAQEKFTGILSRSSFLSDLHDLLT